MELWSDVEGVCHLMVRTLYSRHNGSKWLLKYSSTCVKRLSTIFSGHQFMQRNSTRKRFGLSGTRMEKPILTVPAV